MREFLALFLLIGACAPTEGRIRPSDQPLVDRALYIYGKGKISPSKILEDVEPAVVYLPQMQCVGLNLKAGVAGGDTTICFDYKGRHVLSYVSGD